MKKIALIVAVLAATACGHPSQGMVVGKVYEPRSTYQTMVCTMYNKNGVCQIWMPQTHVKPECWKLLLKNGDEEWGQCVNKDYYDSKEIGTMWQEEA